MEPTEPIGAAEVKSRATAGAGVLGARAALVYAIGIGANLLLARLLVPRDFGLVALGTMVLTLGVYLGETGLGAALLQRRDEPTRAQLEAVAGLQLTVTGLLAVVAAAAAAPFGRDGLVVALMVASLPISVLRSPAVIVLERRLHYRVIARADVIAALSYYAWAIATVAAGLGVWGLASAVIVRAVTGSAVMIIAGPLGLVRPRWSWRVVRPLLGFGAAFGATQLLQIVREQVLNVVIAAVAGLATLGVWNLAWRVLQVPNLLFLTAGRIAFPSMSRLLGAGEDPRRAIERSLAAVAVVTGVAIAALVGFAPALPAVVGDGWEDVPAVLLWSGVALIVSAPIAVTCAGYLAAAGAPGAVARATIVSMVVWVGVAVALLPEHGAPAAAIGWIPSGIIGGAMLWRATTARTPASIAANLAAPTLVALAAAAAGWLAAQQSPDTLPGGVLGIFVAEAILFAGLTALSRPALRDTRALVAGALPTRRSA